MNLESKPFTKIYCGKELLKALDTVLQDKNKEQMKAEKKQEEKKPLFKVGQIVRIKVREGKDDDYEYSFTDDMTKYSGRLCTIAEVDPNWSDRAHKYPDDRARYNLKEHGPNGFNWASSMLEEAELPEPTYRLGQKVRIVKRQTFDGKPLVYGDVYYTDEMLKHRGEVHEIEGIDFHTGAFLPQDDYHIYRLKKVSYAWTKSMLEPIEDAPKPKDEVDMMEGNSEHVDKAYLMYKLSRAMNWPKEYFYRLDEENGGDIWWPESLLTEIN